MKKTHWILTSFLLWCTFPLFAQSNGQTNAQKETPLNKPTCTVCQQCDSCAQGPHKTLNNTASLETKVANAIIRAQAKQQAQHASYTTDNKDEVLSSEELIEAETELQLIRERKDPRASFETYPHLLHPKESPQPNGQSLSQPKPTKPTPRTQFPKGWAKKVGL